MIQTDKIPELIDPQSMYSTNGQEAWRVLGIMAEFAVATERLRGMRPAVSMFGSARIKAGHPYYQKAERIARLLSDAGFSVNFGYFFARKMMFVRFASAYVVLPGGFGTIDELTECLTLVQTGKARKIPIILVGGEFWSGLIDWMRDKLVGEGMIAATDLGLMQVIEEPQAIVEAIFDYYETHGFQPTMAERNKMLNL